MHPIHPLASRSLALLRHSRGLSVGIALLMGPLSGALFGQLAAPGYHLGPGDTISVTITEVPELGFSSPVSATGTITLPDDMGLVRVSGLTAQQAQRAVKTRMERFLRSATVGLSIDQMRSSTVRLLGSVNQPGDRTISNDTTLFELLTRKDELREGFAGTVVIRRSSSAGYVDQVEIPLSGLLQDLNPRYDIPLMNRDIITIPAGQEITVYLVGEVSASITFGAGEPKTLVRAIAKAGGLTERSSGKLVVTRTSANGSTEVIEARYKRILDGRDPDIKLERGDLIRVKRSII